MISPFSTGLMATLALATWVPLTAVSAQETTATTAQGDRAHRALEQLFEHLDANDDGIWSALQSGRTSVPSWERTSDPPRPRASLLFDVQLYRQSEGALMASSIVSPVS